MNIERWEIDSSRSGIRFAVRHLVLSKTRGRFSRWSGTVLIPDGDVSRAIQAMHTGPQKVVQCGVPRDMIDSIWRWR